jgi:Ca2+-binding RTX toxin-like protein
LTARATDWANATQATDYPVSFTLDTNVPTVSIATVEVSSTETWAQGSGMLRFNGAASDSVALAAVQLKVGNQPFADAKFSNGQWQIAYPVPDPEGQMLTVVVRAIDRAGQIAETTKTVPVNFTVPTPPNTTITSGPATTTGELTASFIFTGTGGTNDLATFECKLDEGEYEPCASPFTLTDLSVGSHTLLVRSIDSAGFVDPSPASHTWVVDAPAPTITGHPEVVTSSRTATFTFTGGGSFQCSLDTADFTACTSGQTYSGLADGQHIFWVRASEGGATARFVWTVTNAAPLAANQAVTTTAGMPVVITLTATDEDALTWQIIDPPQHGGLEGVAPHLVYRPDTDYVGTDSFTFAADDEQSRSNMATVSITVQPSTTPQPLDTTITAQPPLLSGSAEALFEFRGSGGTGGIAGFECSLDNAPFTPCASPHSYSTLSNGEHSFAVRAVDGAGTVDATPAAYTWTINVTTPDTTPPETTITAQPPNPSVSADARFEFGGTDNIGIDHFECSLDNAPFAICTSAQTYTGLSNGQHTFSVRAVDGANNVDATPATYTWSVQPLTFVGACGAITVYRNPQGQLVALPGWSGTIHVGTSGANTINGDNRADLMLGLGGNDKLDGKGGDDLLCGGDGVDQLLGAAGKDYLDGGTSNDVLNGGAGDHDTLLAGDGNDTLLDGDGVISAQGGAGTDTFTLSLRNGWRDLNAQPRFNGLAAGYGNDTVTLAIQGSTRFYLDITGDERDNPPSPLEGATDSLLLTGVIDATSQIVKFERRSGTTAASAESSLPEQGVVLDRGAPWATLTDESGAEFLTEPVGGDEPVEVGESTDGANNWIFLPMVAR